MGSHDLDCFASCIVVHVFRIPTPFQPSSEHQLWPRCRRRQSSIRHAGIQGPSPPPTPPSCSSACASAPSSSPVQLARARTGARSQLVCVRSAHCSQSRRCSGPHDELGCTAQQHGSASVGSSLDHAGHVASKPHAERARGWRRDDVAGSDFGRLCHPTQFGHGGTERSTPSSHVVNATASIAFVYGHASNTQSPASRSTSDGDRCAASADACL